jgi:hypothetical protein
MIATVEVWTSLPSVAQEDLIGCFGEMLIVSKQVYEHPQ